MNREQKLEQWAEREFKRNIKTIIVDDGQGSVMVFGRYWIEPVDTRFCVRTWTSEIHCFSSKKAAMAWCTADNQEKFNLSNNILMLDKKKQALAADIYCRKMIGDHSRNGNFYDVVNTKVQSKIDLYNLINLELEKCLNRAKYLQIRGFNNETARTIGSDAK